MQGELNFTGTLAGSISDSGGGGSSVEISPTLQSGVKIADYTIDSVNGSLYAPETSGGSTVEITPTLQSGVKIADYSIDGDSGIIYAPPDNIQAVRTPLVLMGTTLGIDLSAYYTKSELDIMLPITYQKRLMAVSPIQITGGAYDEISLTFDISDYLTKADALTNYQQKLTAGRGLSIDPSDNSIYTSFVIEAYQEKLIAGDNISIDANNVISASSGSGINYSTTEQDTGIKWVDGRHIYQLSFAMTQQITLGTNGYGLPTTLINPATYNIDALLDGFMVNYPDKRFVQFKFVDINNNLLRIAPASGEVAHVGDIITIKYVKTAS